MHFHGGLDPGITVLNPSNALSLENVALDGPQPCVLGRHDLTSARDGYMSLAGTSVKTPFAAAYPIDTSSVPRQLWNQHVQLRRGDV